MARLSTTNGVGRSGLRDVELCPPCLLALDWFLFHSVEHVRGTDPVTMPGLAHITTCPECTARFGSAKALFALPECPHEDMSCPPGECNDLYPPNREDSGR